MTTVRRTDAGVEIPLTRSELLSQLATLDPSFNPSGRSDDYLRARLDAAIDSYGGTADAAQAAMRERNANAWKGQHSSPSHRADAKPRKGEEDDAEPTIDPDAAAARMRKRNEDAWKGKSGVQMLDELTANDADKNGVGAFGMRHGRT